MKFQVGQRVIVVKGLPGELSCTTPETWNHLGYYGHVEYVDEPNGPILQTLYWVRLSGRTGCEAAPWMLSEPGMNPFGFWEHQLEAAD